MTFVKICGITNLEDASLAVDLGADMIGFNFYRGSKRYVSPKGTASIVEGLTEGITKVGVFVNATIGDILFATKLAHLDSVQLHGNESPQFVAELRDRVETKIIKAIRVRSLSEISSLTGFRVDAILLDTYSATDFGGTGETFDWQIARAGREKVDQLILAGGLSLENVAEAIRIVRPYAVDVASGVESSPRKKDPKKLEAFIRNAKNA
ncbi:MAG: phosphoribosylanthranilate isomerase [bacterium]|nr:phosphoribosylanthranilate isomerase [bacterium]